MLGLVAYGSDESDDDIQIEDSKPRAAAVDSSATKSQTGILSKSKDEETSMIKDAQLSSSNSIKAQPNITTTTLPVARSPDMSSYPAANRETKSEQPPAVTASDEIIHDLDPVVGPSMGPMLPRVKDDADIDDADSVQQPDFIDPEEDPELAQMSPYSRNRAVCRSYTMPPLTADFSIPETPPGSPPRDTTQRFANFLKLKEKNVHFNSKLAQSTGLRNPNFLDKLMEYVQLDADGSSAGQYSSNWRRDVWDPRPEVLGAGIDRTKGESFAEALGRLQKEGFERRQQKERTAVDFVGAGSVGNAAATAAATATEAKQSSSSRHESSNAPSHRSAAERVMAGLDRDSSRNSSAKNSPSRDTSRRKDGGGGSRRRDDKDNRDRRRRSRSRSRSRDRARYRERDYGRR